eukprot:CAMPEP_0118889040 /NCGR_PEP_ID=MMETSP1166-20130328/157_1 /TAXON_ID=1104430 /ORGANISM="Chrysoreinhardia sp, Strain CCMP3193" /LENGTH=133 /DNA_ID=CAMNT_0006827625 /DNA_START=139 /DNA_END=540 /DNA_ORIENTATION=-
MTDGVPGVSAFPSSDSMFDWIGTLNGTKGTPYDGMSYKLNMKFPQDYPYNPPTIKFITPCWHPNVDTQGNICLDILKEKWSAAYSVKTILLSLQTLLGDPNCDSPLNSQAAQLWEDQDKYLAVLKEKYAMNSA